MTDVFSPHVSSSPKQLIKETVQAVIKALAKGTPFSQSVFNTPQAANYLSTSPAFLAKLRAQGKGPPYIQIESAIRYKRCDIDNWLAQRVITPSDESQSFHGEVQ